MRHEVITYGIGWLWRHSLDALDDALRQTPLWAMAMAYTLLLILLLATGE
jgi:hypothetical protein